MQTRYEMLRRVRTEGHSVTATTAWYGVSRPTFYKLLAAFEREGLWGLLPRKRGPKGGHKLRPEVMDLLQSVRETEPSTTATQLVALVRERFDIEVHPRTVERALQAATKKNVTDRARTGGGRRGGRRSGRRLRAPAVRGHGDTGARPDPGWSGCASLSRHGGVDAGRRQPARVATGERHARRLRSSDRAGRRGA